jgi:protein-S-isoprenylcysteine O-methyltransferase Ste14
VILAVRHLVIRPEEQYLTHRFGQTYTDYQTRVRRWL